MPAWLGREMTERSEWTFSGGRHRSWGVQKIDRLKKEKRMGLGS